MGVIFQLKERRQVNLASSLLSAQYSGFIKAKGPELGSVTAVCIPALQHDPLLVPQNPESSTVQGREKGEEECRFGVRLALTAHSNIVHLAFHRSTAMMVVWP